MIRGPQLLRLSWPTSSHRVLISLKAPFIAAREKGFRSYQLASFAGIDPCDGLKRYNFWVWKNSPACPACSVQHAFNCQRDCNAHMMVRHMRANDDPSKKELELPSFISAPSMVTDRLFNNYFTANI